MFFDLIDMTDEKLRRTNVAIRVMNKGFLKNEIIGDFEFDIQTTYLKDKHMIEHQWIGIQNSGAEDFDKSKGMLKVSLAIRGPGDRPYPMLP